RKPMDPGTSVAQRPCGVSAEVGSTAADVVVTAIVVVVLDGGTVVVAATEVGVVDVSSAPSGVDALVQPTTAGRTRTSVVTSRRALLNRQPPGRRRRRCRAHRRSAAMTSNVSAANMMTLVIDVPESEASSSVMPRVSHGG
ncbi:MAG: hypothetical protein RJA49_3020, partial [Actinomycetota bacterium]